jgi:hypothetical protein
MAEKLDPSMSIEIVHNMRTQVRIFASFFLVQALQVGPWLGLYHTTVAKKKKSLGDVRQKGLKVVLYRSYNL